MREGRRQTVVKMNFESGNNGDAPDKSFQSSSESIVVEEKISMQSSSIKSAISSAKSTSAVLDINRTGAAKETAGKRKLLSAR